jgi:adenosylcobinamide-phosphate synthase
LQPIDPSILISAVILDLLIGDPCRFPHPVVFIGRLINTLEKALRRLCRDERFGGVVLLLLTIAISAGIALLMLRGAYSVSPWIGFIVAVFLSWSCLAARSLHLESRLVAEALSRGDLAAARRYLSRIVGRDTEDLDEAEIWRAAVETVAENTSDGVIAPLFCLMIGGPVLGLAYKAVNTLDSMVGYKNERYINFGWASARFDDLANYIPARLTGLLIVASAPLAGSPSRDAWRVMRRDGRNHTSPNSGIPEAAVAGALGVRLGGTNLYGGRAVEKPTIGDPVNPLSQGSWRGAVRLMYGAEALLLAVWLLIKYLHELTGLTGLTG